MTTQLPSSAYSELDTIPSMVCDSTGQKIYISQLLRGVNISQDYGSNFTLNTIDSNINEFLQLVSNPLGDKLLLQARDTTGGLELLYESIDSGSNWSNVTGDLGTAYVSATFTSIATDFNHLAYYVILSDNTLNRYLVPEGGPNGSPNWSNILSTNGDGGLYSVACDGIGQKVCVIGNGNSPDSNMYSYTSTDYGSNWTSNIVATGDVYVGLRNIKSDISFQNLIATSYNSSNGSGGDIWISSNSGSNWNLSLQTINGIQNTAISSDGSRYVVGQSTIFYTAKQTNATSWTPYPVTENIFSVMMPSNYNVYTTYLQDSNFYFHTALAPDALQKVLYEFRFQEKGPLGISPVGPTGPGGDAYSLPILEGGPFIISQPHVIEFGSNSRNFFPMYQALGNALTTTTAFSLQANLSFYTSGVGQWQMTIVRSSTSNDSGAKYNIMSGSNNLDSFPYSSDPFYLTAFTTTNNSNGTFVSMSASCVNKPGSIGSNFYKLALGYISDESSSATITSIKGRLSIMQIKNDVSALTSPLELSDLVTWYDGTDIYGDGTIIANGTYIGTWYSKPYGISGGLFKMMNKTGSGGTYSNGSIFFTDSWYQAAKYLSFTYPIDTYAVVKVNNASLPNDVISLVEEESTEFNSFTLNDGAGGHWNNNSLDLTRTSNAVAGVTETSTDFLIMRWSIADHNFLIYRNGTQIMQTNAYTYSPTNNLLLQLGKRSYSSVNDAAQGNFNGALSEVITYNRQLGTDERQRLEGYLAIKWGLQSNLPNGHPFK